MLLFAREQDARKVMAVLSKRFGKYGLTLHPEKTRLVEFRRPDRRVHLVREGASRRPGTFDFLGFTHYGGKNVTVRRSTFFRGSPRSPTLWWHETRQSRAERSARS